LSDLLVSVGDRKGALSALGRAKSILQKLGTPADNTNLRQIDEQIRRLGAEAQPASEKLDPYVSDDVGKARGTAWLSYLGILWLIPLLTQKGNPFAKFHVKQGIMLSTIWAASLVLAAIPFVGLLADLVLWVYALVAMIAGIINALRGRYWTMPIAGKWAARWFKF
jgi:uncharacterized membrane protein